MTIQDSKRGAVPIAAAASAEVHHLGAMFDAHIAREFADLDVDATMETMVAAPYVYFGGEGGRRFYSEHFINQIPKDTKVTPISRTICKDQVVDELIVSFTHNTQWDYLLPGIPPTGKKVELPHVVVMKFGKRESRARARLVGPGLPACVGLASGSGEAAGGWYRTGQNTAARAAKQEDHIEIP